MASQNTDRGQRIRVERDKLGLTISGMARLGGVSKGSQILYEKGNPPTADYLAALAGAGVDVLYLLIGTRISIGLDDEVARQGRARCAWLAAEKAALVGQRGGQIVPEPIGDERFKGKAFGHEVLADPLYRSDDMLTDGGVGGAEAHDETKQDHFKDTGVGGRVAQHFKLLLVHLIPRRLRRGERSAAVDSPNPERSL